MSFISNDDIETFHLNGIFQRHLVGNNEDLDILADILSSFSYNLDLVFFDINDPFETFVFPVEFQWTRDYN